MLGWRLTSVGRMAYPLSSIVRLKPELRKRVISLVVQSAICVWVVGVSLWYFWQLSPVFSPLLKRFLQKIWH